MVGKFVKKIIKLRRRNKISQEEMAERLGISITNLVEIERGETEPDVEQCLIVADMFGISRSEMFKDYQNELAPIVIMPENGEVTEQEPPVIKSRKKKMGRRPLLIAIAVLLMANIGFELVTGWYSQYKQHNFISATVLAVENNTIKIKNRGNYGIEGDDIFVIKLNDELASACTELERGDVVRVHYYVTLFPEITNPSWFVSEIRYDKYMSGLQKPYY